MQILTQRDDDSAFFRDQNANNVLDLGSGFTASTAANISNIGLTALGTTAATTFTLDAPAQGCMCELIMTAGTTTINTVASGSTSISFDGTTGTQLTFNGINEAVILKGISTTRWAIKSNVGAVGVAST